MKKWIKKVLAGAIVLSSSIGLAGCGIFQDKPAEAGYEFKNYDKTYYIYDEFSITGTMLRIIDKKGNVEEILVTEDMIKRLPDMTTVGKKTVVIEYNGVDYSFTITIENRTQDQLLAKLQSFLRRYESGKDSLVDVNIDTNLQAKYLENIANINEQETITLLSEMFKGDKLLDATYNSLFDAIVQGSFDLDESHIIDTNDMKAKLDTLKVLESIKQSVSEFDIRTYIIDLILPKTDAYYIEKVADYFATGFEVNSVTGKIKINDVVSKYYYKLKHFESFDIVDAYTELLTQINIHTVNPMVKEATANLKTLDVEQILHLPSKMTETYWKNYAHVMTADNFAIVEYAQWGGYGINIGDVSSLFENNKVANDLLKAKINAETTFALSFENAIIDLVKLINGESEKEFKDIVLEALDKNYSYANLLATVDESLQANKWILMTYEDDWCYGVTDGYSYWGGDLYPKFEAYYDVEYYTEYADTCKTYYDKINDEGFVGAVKQAKLVENLLDYAGYIESDRQQATNKIYGILDGEYEGEDLYWAIADVLFPNGAAESIEDIKNIVKSYLDSDLVGAIEQNELVEKLFDLIDIYPEENKQQAIDTIYSIIKGEKQGKEAYSAIVNIVMLEENDYYIDLISNAINDWFMVESATGQEAVQKIITEIVENLRTATEFDVKQKYTDLIKAINIHTTNEMVKTFTNSVESLEFEQIAHLTSELMYTMYMETYKIATPDQLLKIDYQEITTPEAQQLINRYASNIKNTIRVFEDTLINIGDINSFGNFIDKVLTCVKALEDYYSEEIDMIKILKQNNWVFAEEYETLEGTELDTYLYCHWDYDSTIGEWVISGIDYDIEIMWLEDERANYEEIYKYVNIVKSLTTDINGFVDELIQEYKQDILDIAMEFCYDYLAVNPNSYLALDLEDVFSDAIDDYLAGTLDKQQLMTDIETIIDTYATKETRTVLNTAFMLYSALNYDESIDYNELFKDITLPNQVESIDYNKLMSKVMDKDTYEIFNFSDVEIEYITDDAGKIVAEKLTLKIDVNFDVLISSLKGDVVVSMTLDFDGVEQDI